jgi:deoxyribonuclease V
MILAFDTYYFDNKAKTVCLEFETWTSKEYFRLYSEITDNIEEYISGEFYKRELPLILSLYEQVEAKNIEAIIVDGFVYLDDNKKLGLGGYLYKALGEKIPVIGVAKTNYVKINKLKKILLRGKSINPLYITSAGIKTGRATELIKKMTGNYRIPAILKYLDTLTKKECWNKT